MAYSVTVDEKSVIYGPGELDAPSYRSSAATLAPGITGYGFLDHNRSSQGDIDYYHLGTLSSGTYLVEASGQSWRFDSTFSSNTYIDQVATTDNLGRILGSGNYGNPFTFTLWDATDVYLYLDGQTFSSTQYNVTYRKYPNTSAVYRNATISGEHRVGETLTASLRVFDSDGMQASTVLYGWYAGDELVGAGNQLTLTQEMVGENIGFSVVFQDDRGNYEVSPTYSIPGEVVVRVENTAASGIPIISGELTQGTTIEANTSSIQDANGLGAFSYAWMADGAVIAGATDRQLTLNEATWANKYQFALALRIQTGSLKHWSLQHRNQSPTPLTPDRSSAKHS